MYKEGSEEMQNTILQVPDISVFLEKGLHLGHDSTKWNPKMKNYVYTRKNNINIINILKTKDKLIEALNFLKKVAENSNILILGTKRQASELVKNAGLASHSYYVHKRWIGGMFSNFEIVKKSIHRLNKLEEAFERGVQDRTKYEIMLMKKSWTKLNKLFQGVKTLDSYPGAIFVVDVNYEKPAVKEAKELGIAVVGIVDTNSDPDFVDYVIPANDDSISSLSFILDLVVNAILAGNKGVGVKHSLVDYSKFEVKVIKTEQNKLLNDSKENSSDLIIISQAEQEPKNKPKKATIGTITKKTIKSKTKT